MLNTCKFTKKELCHGCFSGNLGNLLDHIIHVSVDSVCWQVYIRLIVMIDLDIMSR